MTETHADLVPGHPDFPWEPPLAGGELRHLLGMLERLRWTFRWKAAEMDAAGLAKRLGPSTLTIGGLLKHLAAVEALRFSWEAFHQDPGEPWRSADWSDPDWVFTSAADDTPSSCTPCTTSRWPRPGSNWRTPSRPAASTSRPRREPASSTPACAGWCAT